MAASNERRTLRTSHKIIRRGNGNSSCEYCLFTRGGAGTQARAGHTQLHWAGARAGQADAAHGRRAAARAEEIRAAEAAVAGGVGGAGAASPRARMRAQGAEGKGGGIARIPRLRSGFRLAAQTPPMRLKLQAPSCEVQAKPRSFDSGFPRRSRRAGALPPLRLRSGLAAARLG